MLDGRQPSLEEQAAGAINDHAQAARPPANDLKAIAEFQKTNAFYSSSAMRALALGGPAPGLPAGKSASEKRGRRFFEDVAPDPNDFRPGLCSHCHSGPLMNQTNEFAKDFIGLPIPKGARFIGVGVSEVDPNPPRVFVFDAGTPFEFAIPSTDPGRALITGDSGFRKFVLSGFTDASDIAMNINAFKISQLRGIRNTAPYFHNNSAKTLEDVAAHYSNFFSTVTGGAVQLSPQDQQDIVAFMKLLD
jgi:cytochrome c peroxidase